MNTTTKEKNKALLRGKKIFFDLFILKKGEHFRRSNSGHFHFRSENFNESDLNNSFSQDEIELIKNAWNIHLTKRIEDEKRYEVARKEIERKEVVRLSKVNELYIQRETLNLLIDQINFSINHNLKFKPSWILINQKQLIFERKKFGFKTIADVKKLTPHFVLRYKKGRYDVTEYQYSIDKLHHDYAMDL